MRLMSPRQRFGGLAVQIVILLHTAGGQRLRQPLLGLCASRSSESLNAIFGVLLRSEAGPSPLPRRVAC